MAQQNESKFVNEWLLINHPSALTWKRVRLGPMPAKGAGAFFGVVQRWVDAIFFEDDTVHIVEAKLQRDMGMISQLLDYREQFAVTPEFSQFRGKRVKLIALMPFNDRDIESMARKYDIEYVVFQPAWLMKIIAEK